MSEMNLDIASEYLVMASELLEYKSKSLLPKKEDEEEIDPKDTLIKKLVDYKKKLLIYRDFLKEQRANMREDNHQKRDMQIAKEAWELYDIIMSRDDLFSLGDVAKALEREDIVLKSNDSLAKVRENGQKRNFDDRIFKYYLPIWRQDEKKLAKMEVDFLICTKTSLRVNIC